MKVPSKIYFFTYMFHLRSPENFSLVKTLLPLGFSNEYGYPNHIGNSKQTC